MTSKADVKPGTQLRVVKHPITLAASPGGALAGSWQPKIGDLLEVLESPKKYQGINCVKVRCQGLDLYAYYCDIRYNTSL